MNTCKTCGHAKEDHKGTAMICMRQIGNNPGELCDCCWFDDGKSQALPKTLEAFVLKGKEEIQKENK